MEIYTHAVADGLHSAPVRDVVTRFRPAWRGRLRGRIGRPLLWPNGAEPRKEG